MPDVAKPAYLNISTPNSTVSWESCQAILSWGAPEGAEEYQLWWSTIENEGRGQEEGAERQASQGGLITLSTTRHTLNSLYCQTDHQFKVRARGDGTGDYSDQSGPFFIKDQRTGNYNYTPQEVMDPPTNLQATERDGEVYLTWETTETDSDVTYQVQQKWITRAGVGTEVTQTLPVEYAPPYSNPVADQYTVTITSSTSATVGGWLREGQNYTYKVRARNDGGVSLWSQGDTTQITRCPDASCLPANLRASAPRLTDDGVLTLLWDGVDARNPYFYVYTRVIGKTTTWKVLPHLDYTITTTTTGATITQIAAGETYQFKVFVLADGAIYNSAVLTLPTKARLPTHGHQADHTVQYLLDANANALIKPMLDTALTTAAARWNNLVFNASSLPQIEFCEQGLCGSRNTDGYTTTVYVNDGELQPGEGRIGSPAQHPDCGSGMACVGQELGGSDHHLTNATMRIEFPAYEWSFIDGRLWHIKHIWVGNSSEHEVKFMQIGSNLLQKKTYLPMIVAHELGHAAGLADLADYEGRGYENLGSIMHYNTMTYAVTTISNVDRLYMREAYRTAAHGSSPH